MGKPKIRYDMILFALLMALLFVPLLQEHTGLFNVKPLKGVFEPTPKPELTFESYRTSTYQTQIEKYASENFGLREPIIRIYNQYLWTAFNKTYCHFIVPGKDGFNKQGFFLNSPEQRKRILAYEEQQRQLSLSFVNESENQEFPTTENPEPAPY